VKTRTFLGRDQNLGVYRRVYEIEGGLEIDENSIVEIERTRVYFDDVLGITYHRQANIVFLIGMGFLGLMFGGIALLILASEGEKVAAAIFAFVAAPFLVLFFVGLILKLDVITVFGKRTMAVIRFGFRKARAREIYRDLTQKIRACQEKTAAAQPKPPPAPATEPPLPSAPSSAPEPGGATEGKPPPAP